MRGLAVCVIFLLFITIILPITLIKGCNILPDSGGDIDKIVEDKPVITILNTKTQKVQEMELEEYVKGVVAAEMPAEFHIEALKAQAVAARTYAIYRINKYKNGNPEHPQAPLCTGIHCQAWLGPEELVSAHGEGWMTEYWSKIEEAVESTEGQIITYMGEPIEPLYHSTSGGMTEDSEDVFSTPLPYLRSVESPYEEDAPKFRDKVRMTVEDFIEKIESKYPNVRLAKSNLQDKIHLVERSSSGRIKKVKIDTEIVTGRDIRSLFNLNSTNFKITLLRDGNIEIETIGYGHGVGMSQWGANGMAKKGNTYEEILKHYYTGVEIELISEH